MYTHTCMHTHTHTHAHACVHTHTHTFFTDCTFAEPQSKPAAHLKSRQEESTEATQSELESHSHHETETTESKQVVMDTTECPGRPTQETQSGGAMTCTEEIKLPGIVRESSMELEVQVEEENHKEDESNTIPHGSSRWKAPDIVSQS